MRNLVVLFATFVAISGGSARAQNAPLSGLPPRGSVEGSDLVPCQPAAGPQLEACTVSNLGVALGGGVSSFNTRTGAVTLESSDVLAALGFAPMDPANNLSDLANVATARTNLGLGYFATGTNAADLTGTLACAQLPAFAGALTNSGCTLSLVASGVTAGVYANPSSVTVNAAGQVTAITAGCGPQCLAPNLIKFGPPTHLPYYDPQPAGLINVSDTFSATGNYTAYTSGGGGTPTFSVSSSAGTLTISSGADGMAEALSSDTTLTAPQAFVSIYINAMANTGTGYDQVKVGICKDASDYAVGYYDVHGNLLSAQLQHSGSFTSGGTTAPPSGLTLPFYLGFSLVDNSLTVWVRQSANVPWTFIQTYMGKSVVDFTASGAMSGYQACVAYAINGGTSHVQVTALQEGRFGGVVMRDLKPVVNADWTTYQPGSNLIYFVASTNDPDSTQFGPSSGGSLGVFTLNMVTQAITETGVICISRSSHVYCGDNAGSIVQHTNGDEELLTSSWSDYVSGTTLPHAWYDYKTGGGLLSTNLSVISSSQLTMPGSCSAVYDPAMAYVGGTYYFAWTCGNSNLSLFYPALSTASTPNGTQTSVGIDSNLLGNYEGTSFVNASGVLYEVAGGPRSPGSSPAMSGFQACSQSRVYNSSFVFQGQILGATFDANTNTTSPVNCSHPTMFQHPDGQHEVLLTFDGTEFDGQANSTGQPMIEFSTP